MTPQRLTSRVTGGAINLAWTPFVSRRAGTHIFVSADRTQQLLQTLEYEGRRIDRCPAMLGRVLLARALGRIVAHEIGHCLYGPSHEKGGLMKVMLTGQDLLGIPEPPMVIAGRALR